MKETFPKLLTHLWGLPCKPSSRNVLCSTIPHDSYGPYRTVTTELVGIIIQIYPLATTRQGCLCILLSIVTSKQITGSSRIHKMAFHKYLTLVHYKWMIGSYNYDWTNAARDLFIGSRILKYCRLLISRFSWINFSDYKSKNKTVS